MRQRSTISIVDDDESVRRALGSLLRSYGHSTALFASAEEFLASDVLDSTCCLIVDMQMPGMTGLQLLDQLRTEGRSIPAIVITAFPDAANQARLRSVGTVAYLNKPCSEEVLLKSLAGALGG